MASRGSWSSRTTAVLLVEEAVEAVQSDERLMVDVPALVAGGYQRIFRR